LRQTGECQNVRPRLLDVPVQSGPQASAQEGAQKRLTTRQTTVGYERESDAFAGVDNCNDWFTPALQPGVKLVVCNQSVLTRDIGRALDPPLGDPRIVGANIRTATAGELPAELTMADPAQLSSVRVVAGHPVKASVYVAERASGKQPARISLFENVPLSVAGVRVEGAYGAPKLVTAAGAVLTPAKTELAP
jgi:hypothetical protein